MTHVADQLNQFREFALARLRAAGQELLIDELYDEWRLQNPNPQQMANDTLAVAAALNDFRNGVVGKPAAEVIQKLKTKLAGE